MVDENREFSGRGPLNDFVDNFMKILLQRFHEDDMLKNNIQHKAKVNPDKVDISDLPALFVWVENLGGDNQSLGQGRERELTEKIEIQVKIRYVSHKVDGEQKAEEVREIAGKIFEHLISNKNVNDLSEITNIGQVDFSTSLLFVEGKLQPVDGFQTTVNCTYQKKIQQSTRINDRYT